MTRRSVTESVSVRVRLELVERGYRVTKLATGGESHRPWERARLISSKVVKVGELGDALDAFTAAVARSGAKRGAR